VPVVIPTSTTSVTPSPVPTETPAPTLSVKEAEDRIQQLVKDNRGCSLPCWWGITPGKTSWGDARAFLQSIDPTFGDTANATHYSFTHPSGSPGYDISAEFDVDEFGIVNKISVRQTAFSFYLAEFLVMVGKPDKVFLQVYPFTTDGVPPFIILLVYEDLHITAEFVTGATLSESNIVGCPYSSKPSLTLYASNIDVSAELEKKFELERSGGSTPYRLLEESTTMNTNSFYEASKNLDNSNCLETPAEQWNVKQ
jgi:hypothetical protein